MPRDLGRSPAAQPGRCHSEEKSAIMLTIIIATIVRSPFTCHACMRAIVADRWEAL